MKEKTCFVREDNLMTLIIHNLKWTILFESGNDFILKQAHIANKYFTEHFSLSDQARP